MENSTLGGVANDPDKSTQEGVANASGTLRLGANKKGRPIYAAS